MPTPQAARRRRPLHHQSAQLAARSPPGKLPTRPHHPLHTHLTDKKAPKRRRRPLHVRTNWVPERRAAASLFFYASFGISERLGRPLGGESVNQAARSLPNPCPCPPCMQKRPCPPLSGDLHNGCACCMMTSLPARQETRLINGTGLRGFQKSEQRARVCPRTLHARRGKAPKPVARTMDVCIKMNLLPAHNAKLNSPSLDRDT